MRRQMRMRMRRGTTLVEVMVALTIVAVGLLALAAATATLARHRRDARLATVAEGRDPGPDPFAGQRVPTPAELGMR